VTAFSFRRQALDGTARDAVAAVRAAIAVYSSMPSGPLSIRVRAAGATADDVRALDQARLAVRMRAMRTSAFIVPRADARLIAAATEVPASRFTWLLRASGVGEGELGSVRRAVLEVASEPRTPAELRLALAAGGHGAEAAPWSRGAALGRVLSLMTAFGDLVAVGQASLSSNALRYVDRRAWFGPDDEGQAEAPPPAEARAWLAGAYLRSFGPARIEDLTWWAGWTVPQAAAAVAAHDTVDVGSGLLLLAVDLPAFEAAPPLPPAITLLPKWDAWTMGYPLEGRARFVDREVHDRVFDGDGNGLAMVLRAGRAVGAWAHRAAGTSMEADLDLFEGVPAADAEAIEAELRSIAAFLGYRGVVVRHVPTVVPNRRRQRRPLDG